MEKLGNFCLVTYTCCEEEASTQLRQLSIIWYSLPPLQEVVWVSNPPLGNSTSYFTNSILSNGSTSQSDDSKNHWSIHE
jgi:hypothetical protein